MYIRKETILKALDVFRKDKNTLFKPKEIHKDNFKIKDIVKENTKKLPMYFGSFNKGKDVISALEKEGGINIQKYSGTDTGSLYCIRKSDKCIKSIPKYYRWLLEEVYELKNLK